MPDTPISDLISIAARENTVASRDALLAAVFNATLGLHMSHVPVRAVPGKPLVTRLDDNLTFGTQLLDDGRTMVKVCADPPAFRRNFPEMLFQADVSGRELFRMVMRSEKIDGALVCSALSHQAFIISRSTILQMLELNLPSATADAASRATATEQAGAPRWHVTKAAAIGMLDYVLGLLLLALLSSWIASLSIDVWGIIDGTVKSQYRALDGVASGVQFGVTLVGWLLVIIATMVLTGRRAVVGCEGVSVWLLTRFMVLFELAHIFFGPDIAQWLQRVGAGSAENSARGWILSLTQLTLHPYVLVGGLSAMLVIAPRVVTYQRRAREAWVITMSARNRDSSRELPSVQG